MASHKLQFSASSAGSIAFRHMWRGHAKRAEISIAAFGAAELNIGMLVSTAPPPARDCDNGKHSLLSCCSCSPVDLATEADSCSNRNAWTCPEGQTSRGPEHLDLFSKPAFVCCRTTPILGDPERIRGEVRTRAAIDELPRDRGSLAQLGPGIAATLALGCEPTLSHIRLCDGRQLLLRPAFPSDVQGLRELFLNLSPASRWHRFHLHTTQLPDAILRTLCIADRHKHVAVLAEDQYGSNAGSGPVVAEARYIRNANATAAEFALAIAENWRRAGLGTALVKLLAWRARASGIHRLWGDVLAENTSLQHFAHRLGARAISGADGPGKIRLCLDL